MAARASDRVPDKGAPLFIDADRAFDEFFRTEYQAVVRLAFVLCGSLSAAEDLAQDAFIAAHRTWSRVGRYDSPSAWVRRVVANRAVSLTRRRIAEAKALVRLGARQDTPDESRLPGADDETWAAVRSLPRRQAQIVALMYLEDRSVTEAAAVVGCSEGTARTHLRRARAALALRLAVDDREDDREPAG
jgi:RNA polymerase sigma-70 factor (ECF subfamily)